MTTPDTKFFNTPSPPELAPTIRRMATSNDVCIRAIARNIQCEHRIPAGRIRALLDYVPAAPPSKNGSPAHRTITDLESGFRAYIEHRIRHTTPPAFVSSTANRENILYGDESSQVHPDRLLLTVLDLSGLSAVYLWAANTLRHPFLRQFRRSSDVDPTATGGWLDTQLSGNKAIDTLTQILDLLGTYSESVTTHNPTWATWWDEVRDYIIAPHNLSSPVSWLQLLGIVKDASPRWLVPLVYPVSRAGTLAWPTMLEAGWSPFHFPAPPQATPESRGYTMQLHPAEPSRLATEVIHQQIRFTIKDVLHYSGHPLLFNTDVSAATSQHVTPQLTALRDTHLSALVSRHGTSVRAWMSKST